MIIAIAFALIFLIRLRYHWLHWKIDDYQAKLLIYLWRTKASPEKTAEMMMLWDEANMRMEFWRWDFSRYVVYQDNLKDLESFVDKELQRRDTTADFAELEQDLNK